MSKTMCSCLKITKDDIRKSIENGSVCYKDIKKDTKAGTKCGHCKEDIKKFIKKKTSK